MHYLRPHMRISGHRPVIRFLNKRAPAERTFYYQALKGARMAATAV